MKIEYKPDSEIFKKQIALLKSSTWLGSNRQKWIPYLFHFSDIKNVVSALTSGELLSRNLANQLDNFQDIASSAIIEQTDETWKNYVRLYFRPRTPMLHSIEGFRPKHRQKYAAHCPVPIYLLFDFAALITQKDALFSNGNLAKKKEVSIFSKATDFEKLPFKYIYHDSWLTPEERDTIIFHRHAEVIIPNRVGLDNLKFIWCRSQAEYETLRHLLPNDIWQNWSNRIVESGGIDPFFRKWAYVKQATLTKHLIQLIFTKAAEEDDKGPFEVKLTITENWTGKPFVWENKNYYMGNFQAVSLENLTQPQDYTVRFTIDGQLAYANRYQEADLPF